MTDLPQDRADFARLSPGDRVDVVCNAFEAEWSAGNSPQLEAFLFTTDAAGRSLLFKRLLRVELVYRRRRNDVVTIEEYTDRFSDQSAAIAEFFGQSPSEPFGSRSHSPIAVTLEGANPRSGDLTTSNGPDTQQETCNTSTSASPHDDSSSRPERIGRYRIENVLGKGGFGLVYLAYDEQLDRRVAVKVPHRKFIDRSADAESYLIEVRTVANLDHPGIVPVYDVGSTDDYPCYIVSKYIKGTDLSTRLKHQRLEYTEAAKLVATVADALHYAHKRGLVHRDVKPGNIIIDTDGEPHVVDFGLALREANIGEGPKYAGTPAYMSPEQARGEGHRVDGRSDIYSLGAVFYQLLTGRRTFSADTKLDILEQITFMEPKPLRQIDDGIPKELERICLKALSKRASERFTTALDLAEDLRVFLAHHLPTSGRSNTGAGASVHRLDVDEVRVASTTPEPYTVGSDSRPISIVPKGLRSFDEHDADFFLELLPGPRDREGLPDSIRSWKNRIENIDSDNTFSVGLIFGASGCGKSSIMKAGLLPALSEDVISVCIDATPDSTEMRLLRGLRTRCPELPANISLKAALAFVRGGECIPNDKKLLIVIDQFEQWLHGNRGRDNGELVQALRQCDGGRVQCIVMVRDDFWMAVINFFHELEVPLLENHNVTAVPLFSVRHAGKILAAFGRAFGALPSDTSGVTREQNDFLEQSVAGLAEEGEVICVRLALFAEMMNGKPWTPAALKGVGGTQGVGVAFLEEHFSSSAASPEHRYHQKGARAVLKALLPESGMAIKGRMRTRAELLEASGYANRSKEFDELLRILDHDLRLITPTDPEGSEPSEPISVGPQDTYYQLTHDYLVPSLHDWLTRKQRETFRGRAELKLSERSALWNARMESKQLPSLWEWLNIQLLTKRQQWNATERMMMWRAAQQRVLIPLLVCCVIALFLGTCWGGYNWFLHRKADSLVDQLQTAKKADVPGIIAQTDPYLPWAKQSLYERLSEARRVGNSRQELHFSLALLPIDPSLIDYLTESLLNANPDDFEVILYRLLYRYKELRDRLWQVLESPDSKRPRRTLSAAAALAHYDAVNSSRWDRSVSAVVEQLLKSYTLDSGEALAWASLLGGVDVSLRPSLERCRQSSSPERQRAAEELLEQLSRQESHSSER